MMNGRVPHQWQVYLGVRSASVTPDEVTRRLGVPPDRSSSIAGRRWPYLWELESGLAPESELDEHLISLADRCAALTEQIAQLARHPDTALAVEAVLRFDVGMADESAPAMWIPPAAVDFAAACGIGIDIDSYPRR